ncbi:hypothetical protein DEJ50_07140 [Streptomyces venezuelae]|uniref:Secreted protein n=1 Tax=Streptomyces venezuelae TaxID=54571 RepID=A0A5P2D0R6_STRVZ|nr:hypothetical protein [Streptomyces venezuelae]QES47628.1 hypothetical protein DEJ50_07140 [Streptomyces venezuelae]
MNRHRRLALLAPALAACAALAPAVLPPGAAAAPAQPACELVPAAPGMAADQEPPFTLRLTGFRPDQRVMVDGPTDFRATTDSMGEFEEDGVVYGPYRVGFREDPAADPRIITCTTPPRPQPGAVG